MTVKGNVEVVVRAGVNEADEMLLARSERVDVVRASRRTRLLAVDEDRVGSWRAVGALRERRHLEEGLVVPVGQRQGTEVDVIVGRRRTCIGLVKVLTMRSSAGRTIDDDGANDTVAVLAREMRVVPGRSVLSGTEDVGLGLAGCKRAFGHTGSAVEDRSAELTDTVPVDVGTVVCQGVLDSDLNGITPENVSIGQRGVEWSLTSWR